MSAVQPTTEVDPLGRLIAAIADGDVDAAREAYAPGARLWHNTELREQTVDENLRTLRWVIRNVADLRYTDVRRQRTENGFAQQHVLRGTAPRAAAGGGRGAGGSRPGGTPAWWWRPRTAASPASPSTSTTTRSPRSNGA